MKTILTVSLLILCSACASLRGSPHYAIVADHSVTLRDDSDFQRVAEVGKTESNDFVWFVHDGREYVVDDPSFVAEAKRLAGNTFGFRSLIDPRTTHQYRRDIVGDPQNPEYGSVGGSNPAGAVRGVDHRLNRLFAKGLAAGVAKTVSPTSTV